MVSETEAVPILRKLKVCGEDKIITTTSAMKEKLEKSPGAIKGI